jgi:mRNA-degrading endonuclease RelE of RelBE toxin-antitoxin system
MEIYFTKHAKDKFIVLARHGVNLSKRKIINTLENPDTIDYNRLPLLIAQSNLDRSHVLRVVYKKEKELIIVITFYPGRKSQYKQ